MPRLSKVGAAALAAFGWTSGSSVTATYLVVAGGGGGGSQVPSTNNGGGGGAGGYRTGTASLNPTLSYTVTVGAGGAADANGTDSVFSTVTSTGGGKGGGLGANVAGGNGGSGGGGTANGGTGANGGSGNTPSTSPSQGNNGGQGANSEPFRGGGGGGASAAGATGAASGNGGNGTASSISGSSVTYAGGGGGGGNGGNYGVGGTGGGGRGGTNVTNSAVAGTANTGGGGGGSGNNTDAAAGGGSGVVIISYPGAQQFGGGNVTSVGGNTIHTFTTSGTLSPLSSLTAQYLIVAGGAGGGGAVNDYTLGGGGGAGGLLTGTGVTIDTNSNYVVTVGAGGAGGTYNALGGNGGNSTWSMVATTVLGGGAGSAQASSAAASGGSGGGGGSSATPAGGAGTSGQGNAGGTGVTFFGGAGAKSGGGGGGAGAVGGTASGATAGAGGIGVASSITGTSTYYAGGGGGASSSAGAAGGNGGGGAGVTYNNDGVAGTAYTGGGGGGAARNNTAGTQVGGNGGSGVVIIAYPGSTQQMAGGTVTIAGGNVIHTFTSSGYLTPIKYASRSLRFRSSASAYLSRTPTVSGNTTTFTYSVWAKRGSLSSNQYLFWGGNNCTFGFGVVGTDELGGNLRGTGATNYFWNTSGVFRDPSAWYHIVWAVDTTQATDTNRLKVYVNGVQQTLSATYCPQNTAQLSTAQRNIGSESGRYYYDGYLAEVNFIDGQALTPSSFGTFNSYGVWQPITYGGSYGTNGFYLTFGNNTSTTTLGYDTSPQGNNWTTNNISLTAGTTYDSMTDVPTLTSASAANWCTGNPLDGTAGTNIPTYSNGNLTISVGNANYGLMGTMYSGTGGGKFYFEVSGTNVGGIYNTIVFIGFKDRSGNYWGYQVYDGTITSNTGSSAYNGTGYGSGGWPTIGIAVDATNGKIWFRNNSGWYGSGDPASGANPAFTNVTTQVSPYFNGGGGGYSGTLNFNFGQQPFTYTAPTDYLGLNTYNLTTPTIPNGAVYMAATTYTGTGAALTVANTVNGTNFQPDFVWVKGRSGATDHALYDVLRGTTKQIESNNTAAETTESTGLTAFGSTGFTVGALAQMNTSAATYVGWQWKANGTGVTNTSGSITSTVSANTTAGFSVVTYTGTGANATVGHGLGVAPSMVITKNRGAVSDWGVYHTSLGNTNYVLLDTTAASAASSTYWNNTSPTSSVFSIGTATPVNVSTNTYVAYCFAAVAGYSAFGSYTGNGSADGPFVYLGFRPRWIMFKNASAAGNSWVIFDTSRNTYNQDFYELKPDSSGAESPAGSYAYFDFLSNGFKPRTTSSAENGSGNTIIYAAFAENPFKYSNAR